MHPASIHSMQDELQKIAEGMGGHAAELAGLGILAAPSIAGMRGKPWKNKNKERAEVAGLGVLAAPSAIGAGKYIAGKLRGAGGAVLKHASAEDLQLANSALSLFKTASDLWNPGTGQVIGEGGSRAANRGLSTAAAKVIPKSKPKFDINALKAAYQKSGLKPGLASVLKHASVYKVGFTLGKGMMGGHALIDASKAAVKGVAGAAKPAAKMVADPKRAAMLHHFMPPSQVNMSRAISL